MFSLFNNLITNLLTLDIVFLTTNLPVIYPE